MRQFQLVLKSPYDVFLTQILLHMSFLVHWNLASMALDGHLFTFSEKTLGDFISLTHGPTAWTNNAQWKCNSRESRRLDYEPRALLEMGSLGSPKGRSPGRDVPGAWVIWRQEILQLTKPGFNVVTSGEIEEQKIWTFPNLDINSKFCFLEYKHPYDFRPCRLLVGFFCR